MNRCDEALCQEAADKAVQKVFAILGVDINKPESVEEFRADLRFGKKLRRASDHGFLAMVGLVSVAMAAALWAGIVTKLK
jgi:hypothetical protein